MCLDFLRSLVGCLCHAFVNRQRTKTRLGPLCIYQFNHCVRKCVLAAAVIRVAGNRIPRSLGSRTWVIGSPGSELSGSELSGLSGSELSGSELSGSSGPGSSGVGKMKSGGVTCGRLLSGSTGPAPHPLFWFPLLFWPQPPFWPQFLFWPILPGRQFCPPTPITYALPLAKGI